MQDGQLNLQEMVKGNVEQQVDKIMVFHTVEDFISPLQLGHSIKS